MPNIQSFVVKKLTIHKNRIKNMNCFCIEDCNELVNIEFSDNNGKNDYIENEIVDEEEEENEDNEDNEDEDYDDEDYDDDNDEDDICKSQRVFRIINCKSIKE